jgi:hypothetical protein
MSVPIELEQYKDMGIVYGLVDPNTNTIRYIGKSTQGIKRAFNHKKPSSIKEGSTPKNNWIKGLIKNNQMYSVVVLFSVIKTGYTKESLNNLLYKKEQELISIFDNLLNLTDGGPGAVGRILSEESLTKMSESRKKLYREKIIEPTKIFKSIEEKNKTKERRKLKLKARNRKIPGAIFKETIDRGKKIIAKDINGNEIVGFYATRTAAIFLGGKASHTGIRHAINRKSIYYGFYWEYI